MHQSIKIVSSNITATTGEQVLHIKGDSTNISNKELKAFISHLIEELRGGYLLEINIESVNIVASLQNYNLSDWPGEEVVLDFFTCQETGAIITAVTVKSIDNSSLESQLGFDCSLVEELSINNLTTTLDDKIGGISVIVIGVDGDFNCELNSVQARLAVKFITHSANNSLMYKLHAGLLNSEHFMTMAQKVGLKPATLTKAVEVDGNSSYLVLR